MRPPPLVTTCSVARLQAASVTCWPGAAAGSAAHAAAAPRPALALRTSACRRLSLLREQSKSWVSRETLGARIEQALANPQPLGQVPSSWYGDEEEDGAKF